MCTYACRSAGAIVKDAGVLPLPARDPLGLLVVSGRVEAVRGCQIMPFPFAPILFGSHLLVALPAGIPNIDIQKTCQAATSVMVDLMAGSTAERDAEVCLSSERSAQEQLTKDWATYSAAEKTQCVQPSVYLPSYIEWLTCLEMEKSVRKPDTKAIGNTAAPPRRQRAGG
jgi:hypothetical protein